MAAVADGCCSAARTDSASSNDMAERRRSKRGRGAQQTDTDDDDRRDWCAEKEAEKERQRKSREKSHSFFECVAFSRDRQLPASLFTQKMHANDILIVGQGCRSTAHRNAARRAVFTPALAFACAAAGLVTATKSTSAALRTRVIKNVEVSRSLMYFAGSSTGLQQHRGAWQSGDVDGTRAERSDRRQRRWSALLPPAVSADQPRWAWGVGT